MKTTRIRDEEKPVTVADLCEALADGRLASQRNGEYFVIRKNDLRHFVDDYQRPQILHLTTDYRMASMG
jgi:hypothetical protein